jgi:hypothetical protein
MKTQSNQRQTSVENPRKKNRPWLVVLMAVSVLASCTVLIWMFTLPLRKSGFLKASTIKLDATISESLTADIDTMKDPEQIRERAFRKHQDFLYTLKRKREAKHAARKMSPNESQEYRQQQAELRQKKIEQLNQIISETDAPEGSIFREDRDLLIKVNEDMGT